MPRMVREIEKNDLEGLLRLYMQLHDNPMRKNECLKGIKML